MKNYVLAISFFIIMSACSNQPSDNAIQTAIYETQASESEQISLPTKTYTKQVQ